MKNALAAAAVSVALLLSGAVAAPAQAATYKTYTNCTAMHKDYPRGIAATKYRVSKGSKYVWSRVNGKKVKYRPSLISDKAYYKQKSRSDRDKDYVACEKSGY